MTVLELFNQEGLIRTLRKIGETQMAQQVERALMLEESAALTPLEFQHRPPFIQKALTSFGRLESKAFWYIWSIRDKSV